MKTFKQLIAEVAQPKSEDELNFKDKHEIDFIDHPESEEHQHTAEKKAPKRLADYDEDEDEDVYESNLDPVGQEDDDIDNDGDVDDSDEYLRNRRKVIAKAMQKESFDFRGMDMSAIGRRLQAMAPKEKDDMISNAMANLGDHLESFGTPFGAKNMKDLEKKTGLKAQVIHLLIKRVSRKNEAADSPYAIGMASAMKSTGDEPPLKKSTIMKAHKIAKGIMKDDEIEEDATLEQIRAVLTKKNDGTKVIKDKSGYFHIKYKDSSHKGPYHTLKDVLRGLTESRAFIAKAAGAHKADKKRFKLGDKEFPVTIKKSTADKIVGEEVDQMNEMKQPFVVIDTANGNKVVAMASDEQDAKRSIASAERPPMRIKDKSTLKIVKTRKKQSIGYPLNEETNLAENFKAGAIKLNDGSSVLIKDQDAKLLNQMFDDLNAGNKKRMMKVAMTDKNGFNEILGFAREAL